MFDHVKHLKDWTRRACHVYSTRYNKILMIACCDMQSHDGTHIDSLMLKLNSIIVDNGVPNVNLKGSRVENAHAK